MVARGVVKDSFLAEDVVQDSFLKIVKNIDKYKKGTNAYAWVCKIVRNTALNALKSSLSHPTEDIDEFFLPFRRQRCSRQNHGATSRGEIDEFSCSAYRKANDLYEIFFGYDCARNSKGNRKIEVIRRERNRKSRRIYENFALTVDKPNVLIVLRVRGAL